MRRATNGGASLFSHVNWSFTLLGCKFFLEHARRHLFTWYCLWIWCREARFCCLQFRYTGERNVRSKFALTAHKILRRERNDHYPREKEHNRRPASKITTFNGREKWESPFSREKHPSEREREHNRRSKITTGERNKRDFFPREKHYTMLLRERERARTRALNWRSISFVKRLRRFKEHFFSCFGTWMYVCTLMHVCSPRLIGGPWVL